MQTQANPNLNRRTAMPLETAVRKSQHNGWQAETVVDLGAPYILQVSTYKANHGIRTTATRCKFDRGMVSFEVFGDFSERCIDSNLRCTEKNVREQHAKALERIEEIIARCDAFYVAKAAKA